jgi:hypothetical protein
MKTRNKILIGLFLLILLFLVSLCIATFYLYNNPSAVKPFIEKTVSGSTQTTCTIKTLSYSLKPLRFHAAGITLRRMEDPQALHLQIRDLHAVMDLLGPFGRKTLTFKNLEIGGFSCQVTGRTTLPGLKPKGKGPSLVSRILGWVVARFVFRDVTFQAVKVVNGHVTAKFEDATLVADEIHGELNAEHQIVVSASLQMKNPSQNLILTAPQVHLKTHRAISLVDPEIVGTLTARNANYQNHKVSMQDIDADLDLTYSHKQQALFFGPADLRAKGLALRQEPDLETPALSLHLKTTGLFSMKKKTLEASKIDLNLHDALHLKAALDMGLKDHKKFRLQVLDTHFSAQEMLPLLPDKIKRTLAPISLSGPIHLKGFIDGLREEQKWRLNYNLQSFLSKNHITYGMGQIRVDSKVSGTIGTRGHFPDIHIEAKLEGDRTMVSGVGIKPEPFKVGLYLSGKHPVYQIKDASVKIPRAGLRLGKKAIFLDHLQVQARKGRINGQKRQLAVPEIQLDSSLLKNLLISLELDREKLSLQLQGKDVHLLKSLVALELFPPGWQINGKESLVVNAVLNEKGNWVFTSHAGLQDLRFQNQDASSMGENISFHLKLDGELNLKRSQIDAKADLKMEEGEVLYDRFYLDLKRSAFLSSMEGKYVWPQKSLKLSSLRSQLKDILNLDMNGTIHFRAPEPQIHLSLNVPKTELKPLFHHFVLEPFKTERPSLALLKLGGSVSADLDFSGTASHWMAKGRCQWQRGELSSTEGVFSFSGIDLDLPLWVHSSSPIQKLDVKRERLGGRLSIGSFALRPLPVQSLSLPLEASPGQLSVTSSTFFKVPGGKIELGPVVGKDLYRSQRSLETSLTMDAVKLDPLLTATWNRPMTGTLEGRLDLVHLEGNALRTEGNLMARLFGGEILISGLAASGLFTPTPLLKLNAKWQDLHLGDLTGDTPFGRIEGRLMGFVNDLEIAYGQPQRFNLLLETVKKKGVRQKMSQKAVDSIAQIGGGQSPFMGVAGIMTSFFEEFPYEKIGIRASLENDLFRINGTIREGGTEYYVKGSGVPRINIINVNPDNRIRFKDMVKRIRRVATSKKGPVVR